MLLSTTAPSVADSHEETGAEPEQAGAEPEQAGAEPEQAGAEPEQADAEPGAAEAYRWRSASARYIDPTSAFSLHGYVEGTYGAPSDDWLAADSTALPAPGQVLAPNTEKSSFQFDSAIVVGSRLAKTAALALELHLLSDPSGVGAAGPGGLTIAATEALVSIDVLDDYLTVSGGLYWAPFGIVNEDWLGASALFTLVPRGAGAFPTHWNERGVRLSGAVRIDDKYGVNYVASVGNGLDQFDIAGQSSFDVNNDKSYMARVGVFPGLGDKIEVGYSIAANRFRNTGDSGLGLDDPLRYPSRLLAHGADATVRHERFLLRSYYIFSLETLDDAGGVQPPTLSRHGAMMEASYDFPIDSKWVVGVAPKGRADFVSVQTLGATGMATVLGQTGVLSVGVNVYPRGLGSGADEYPYRRAYLSLEYHVHRELEGDDLDNDRFLARLTGRF